MTTLFSTTKRSAAVRSLAIVAALGTLFASCADKHLCPAYPCKPKINNVENVAYSDPFVSQVKG